MLGFPLFQFACRAVPPVMPGD
ncbi:uncharacterized protein METZ01_LOCUS187474 [marine metagenome]|uniref:Uncharacterized protein n=1 Tax=marine metagenome TaxID=408172 RepID=A0A382D870_9ZZZZ